jgi:hypothetical protein
MHPAITVVAIGPAGVTLANFPLSNCSERTEFDGSSETRPDRSCGLNLCWPNSFCQIRKRAQVGSPPPANFGAEKISARPHLPSNPPLVSGDREPTSALPREPHADKMGACARSPLVNSLPQAPCCPKRHVAPKRHVDCL